MDIRPEQGFNLLQRALERILQAADGLRPSELSTLNLQPSTDLSLTDALLLEGYRDPRDVWIALRRDGQKGSGTVDDPFHGGVVDTAPVAATLSLDVGVDARLITATTADPHGYIKGDIVVFSSTRDATGALAPDFDGPYQITFDKLSASQSAKAVQVFS